MTKHPRLVAIALSLLAGSSLVPLALAGPFRVPMKTAQYSKQTGEPPVFGQEPPPPPPFQGQPTVPMPLVPNMPPGMPNMPSGMPNQIQPVPPCENACPGPLPTPIVRIQVRALACSPAGQEIEYRILVENVSAAPAHHVIVRNPLPANARFVSSVPLPSAQEAELIWALGTLAPGCKREICLALAPTDHCDVKNCARVQFEHGQCVVTRVALSPGMIVEPPPFFPKEPPKGTPIEPPIIEPKGGPKQLPKVIEPGDVKLKVKIAGPDKQFANMPVKYEIAVTNMGKATAENVLITAFLPEQSAFLEASDKGRFHFSQVAWLIGDLPPGITRTVQVVYKVPEAGDYCLKAVSMPESGARAEDTLCTKFQGVSALLLLVVDTTDPVAVGGKTSYKIVLLNQGSAPLTNVEIKALVPRELTTLRATGPTEPAAKLPEPTAEGQLVPFPPLKELKAGERQVFEVFTEAVKAGDARFRVVLTADQLQMGGPVIEEESTQVFSEEPPLFGHRDRPRGGLYTLRLAALRGPLPRSARYIR